MTKILINLDDNGKVSGFLLDEKSIWPAIIATIVFDIGLGVFCYWLWFGGV